MTGKVEKYCRIERTFQSAGEGWVKKHRIFNVGAEHTPGLATLSFVRAKQLVDRRLASWAPNSNGATPADDPNDPLVVKEHAARLLRADLAPKKAKTAPPVRRGVAPARKTKVDPPVHRKVQQPDPPAPARVDPARRQTRPAPPTPPSSTSGGKTGPAPASQSSSEEAPPAEPSTLTVRGIRRSDAARKKGASAGVRSMKVGSSSRGRTASTERTGPGGESEKASENSED